MTFQPLGQPSLPASFALPTYRPDRLTHILLGDYAAVVEAINRMELLRYCDRVAWIEPIPTGRSGEYISVMTRRLVTPDQ
ncbi:hypothetical protein C7293_25830 [filamentous cyanobacterium CCT1]|nr:hypothetical protein C7293_25830 [filamentous cyanobacterium CCT1]PSN78476.1 hypothetical protein C8B47_16745 [filamentous cyanobacterium CCP4]